MSERAPEWDDKELCATAECCLILKDSSEKISFCSDLGHGCVRRSYEADIQWVNHDLSTLVRDTAAVSMTCEFRSQMRYIEHSPQGQLAFWMGVLCFTWLHLDRWVSTTHYTKRNKVGHQLKGSRDMRNEESTNAGPGEFTWTKLVSHLAI